MNRFIKLANKFVPNKNCTVHNVNQCDNNTNGVQSKLLFTAFYSCAVQYFFLKGPPIQIHQNTAQIAVLQYRNGQRWSLKPTFDQFDRNKVSSRKKKRKTAKLDKKWSQLEKIHWMKRELPFTCVRVWLHEYKIIFVTIVKYTYVYTLQKKHCF